jgi:prepilin-type N-terminal cleavage/methylation domain-containing protein
MTMRCRSFQRAGGFTLIELLIAMSIFLLVLLGIYQLFDTNRATYISGTRKVDVQQNARVAFDTIAREIKMAGYFPENFDSSTANDLANPQPIQVAQNNGLVVFGDADGSGASSLFLYCLSGTNVIRKRTAVTGGAVTGPAAAYTCSGGDALAENIATLQFTYYDGNNAVLTPIPLDAEGLGNVPNFVTTTNRRAVRTVTITLVATESVPIPGQQPQIFTLTSSVRLRNIN